MSLYTRLQDNYHNDPRWQEVRELCGIMRTEDGSSTYCNGKFAKANELVIKIMRDHGKIYGRV